MVVVAVVVVAVVVLPTLRLRLSYASTNAGRNANGDALDILLLDCLKFVKARIEEGKSCAFEMSAVLRVQTPAGIKRFHVSLDDACDELYQKLSSCMETPADKLRVHVRPDVQASSLLPNSALDTLRRHSITHGQLLYCSTNTDTLGDLPFHQHIFGEYKLNLQHHNRGTFTARTGESLWPAALALCEHLAASSLSVERSIELGCGSALPSILLGRINRSIHIDVTDHSCAVLQLAAANALTNAVNLSGRPFDWTLNESPKDMIGRYDLVLASDVLYDLNGIDAFFHCVGALLSPRDDARLLLCETNRGEEFRRAIEERIAHNHLAISQRPIIKSPELQRICCLYDIRKRLL